MSQCKQSANEFIQSTFSPHIAVLCSNDAQLLCQKNNLSFVQLIQPFCRLSSEVHIRDANNVTHSIHNLLISACDMSDQPPQQNVIKKRLNDTVAAVQAQSQELGANNLVTIGNYDLQHSASTPWFESWRELFLKLLPPSDHEYLNHCLACIFVVASNNSDPLSTFTSLANQQVTQQQQFPNRLPRWFCQGILHYYVLLHDVLDGEQTRAEAVYQSMKATFGVQICHLLQINSRSMNTVESLKSGLSMTPDPWSQFLMKPSTSPENVDNVDNLSNADENLGFPSNLTDGGMEHSSNNPLTDSFYDNSLEESGSSGITNSSSCDQFSHPLASPTTPPSRDTPSPDSDPTAAAGGYALDGRYSSLPHPRSQDKSQSKSHGMCLTPSDLDRLRIFMHEFVVRALIPWAERQMKMLSEQLTSRKGIHRSLFSATKKWFGTKPSGPVPASQNTTVVYTKDAPELHLRRLADLAFLFQMYEFAYNNYHQAKKDFNTDQAWLHFAGALEMASLSTFLQGPQVSSKYPKHYMETAISTYLTSCRNPQYATRATLTSSEALKKTAQYNEAAMQFLKMTSEDSDLTSALFLEQAAHCFLCLKPPMVRKYAFHMILAGHRFSKAGQRKHSLRSYTQALQIYKAKHWSIAEDHIHFTIGRQSVNLKQLESATAAFKHLLTDESKQPTSQQAAFLREYLFVYKQLLSQEERDNSSYGHLPELPLPLVDSNAVKVLLGASKKENELGSKRMSATGMWFNDDDTTDKWQALEEKVVKVNSRPFRPNPQLYTNSTDNKFSPVAFVGEPITIELQVENPLHVMLVLSDVSLLWTFVPSIQGPDPPQVISNEITTGVKNSLADEIIQTSVIKEVIVQGIQTEAIHLTLTPRQPGQLRVVGLAYNLGTSSLAQNSSLQEIGQLTTSSAPSSKPSYTSSVLVRGKQKLEPQGPRLNNTKEERTQKLYGPDRRLDLVVHEEMPCLEVTFCEFPENLLCGEVQCIKIEFSNSGKSPLKNLCITSTHSDFFTFGQSEDLPKYPYVYQMRAAQCSSISSTLTSTVADRDVFLSLPEVVKIPLPAGELAPGKKISLPMWIRGDDIGGIHEVDFLFYYEPVSHSSNVKHRVVRHCTVVNTVESLSVRTTVTRPAARVGANNGQELNSCIFSCELENLSQVQVQRPHVQELQVTQVSCVSPCWTLVSLGAKHHSGVRLGSRETLQLVMKGLKQKQENESKELMFSEVAFDRDQVNSSCSPSSDFFVRSWLRHKRLVLGDTDKNQRPVQGKKTEEVSSTDDLESALSLHLTLVFLWKAYVVQESGQMKIVVGQHHVAVDRLNVCATSYPIPKSIQLASKPQLKFIRSADAEAEEKSSPNPEASTKLVTYSFSHVHQKEHAFSAKGMCVLPVILTLQNHSDREVHIMVDTSKTPESLGSTITVTSEAVSPGSSPFSSHSVRWVGLTQSSVTLSRGQSMQLPLKAGMTRAGTYNLNSLSVFVAQGSDQSQMVLQKHVTPSIITLVDTS